MASFAIASGRRPANATPDMMRAALRLGCAAMIANGRRPGSNTWLRIPIAGNAAPTASPALLPSLTTSFRTVATSACSGTALTGSRFAPHATTHSSSGRSAERSIAELCRNIFGRRFPLSGRCRLRLTKLFKPSDNHPGKGKTDPGHYRRQCEDRAVNIDDFSSQTNVGARPSGQPKPTTSGNAVT